jgi:hypothetical protein
MKDPITPGYAFREQIHVRKVSMNQANWQSRELTQVGTRASKRNDFKATP